MKRAILALVLLALAVVPWFVPSFIAFQLAYAGAYAIAILGLVVLTGNNGQISLGHGAFMAIGGYTVAILSQNAGLAPEFSLVAAALICAAAGALVGIAALRLTGAYLALATFALAVAVPPLIKRFRSFTGGSQGISLSPAHAPALLAHAIDGERWLYVETWVIAGLLFAFTWWLLRGRTGRSLRALRDSEIAAASFGIDPVRYKMFAFSLSAAYAGVAGALIARATAYVSPDTYGLQLSIALVIGLVLGGLDTLWGALIGGLVVEFLPLWAQSINTAASSLIYGVLLILVMVLMPGGIAGALRTSRRSSS
jgi:branched-chain amino acid transport system permease protein